MALCSYFFISCFACLISCLPFWRWMATPLISFLIPAFFFSRLAMSSSFESNCCSQWLASLMLVFFVSALSWSATSSIYLASSPVNLAQKFVHSGLLPSPRLWHAWMQFFLNILALSKIWGSLLNSLPQYLSSPQLTFYAWASPMRRAAANEMTVFMYLCFMNKLK